MSGIVDFLRQWDILGFAIAGFISAVIALAFKGTKSFFVMKRKKYCISKKLLSSTVYQNMDKDGLRISISYNGRECQGPISILKIRLSNDGEEDILYSQRVSHLHLLFEDLTIIDVSAFADIDGVNPSLSLLNDNRYDLKWDLLKRDEYFYIKLVVDGEVDNICSLKFDVRADGIDNIKTPEYKAKEVMLPLLGAYALFAILVALFFPKTDMFIDIIPMKWFSLAIIFIFVLVVWIAALNRRIKWLREE